VLDVIRRLLSDYFSVMNPECYSLFTGQETCPEFSRITRTSNELWSDRVLKWLLSEWNRHANLPGFRNLLRTVLELRLENETREIIAAIDEIESQSLCMIRGRIYSWQELDTAEAMMASADQRRRMEDYRRKVVCSSESLRRQLVDAAYSLAHKVGLKDYTTLCSMVRGRTFPDLETQARRLLRKTCAQYRCSMDRLSRAYLRLPLCSLGAGDIPRLEFLTCKLELESVRRIIDALWSWLAELRLLPAWGQGVVIDVSDRPAKLQRPFCVLLKPGHVGISIPPVKGLSELLALFHEVGHALSFMHCGSDLPPEVVWVGDPAIDESYAFLFENLLLNRDWLNRYLPGWNMIEGYGEALDVFNLLRARRSAGMFLYQVKLYGGELRWATLRAHYSYIMSSAFQYPVSSDFYLAYVDPSFRPADYLEARTREALLRQRLTSLFGTRWFCSRAASGFLRSLWRAGRSQAEGGGR